VGTQDILQEAPVTDFQEGLVTDLQKTNLGRSSCIAARPGVGSKKIFALKSFERLALRLPTPAFRCVQKKLLPSWLSKICPTSDQQSNCHCA
jgi:hypothetical protein